MEPVDRHILGFEPRSSNAYTSSIFNITYKITHGTDVEEENNEKRYSTVICGTFVAMSPD
jgi:hypothetical protein